MSLHSDNDHSEIKEYFSNKVIFLTGATGFLGSVILEKLLRCCPCLQRVYVLIRKKKNKDAPTRLKELLSIPLLKTLREDYLEKVRVVVGDVTIPGLGLNESDLNVLIEEVDIVFHVAASINFSASLDKAVLVNLEGTKNTLLVAKQITNLKCFVYVSTAYCNCVLRDVVAEKVYPNRWEPNELIQLIKALPPIIRERRTAEILGGHPNTYSFTKLLAENLIQAERGDIPVAIVRPSVVLGMSDESPLPGWVDNVNNGGVAFIAGAGRGVFRTIAANQDTVADIVPSDLLASLILAAAWAANKDNDFKIYHFTSGTDNPISWSDYCKYVMEAVHKYPCSKMILYPRAKVRSPFRNSLFVIIGHYLPGFIIDKLAIINGRNPILMDIQHKYSRGIKLSAYFTTNEWKFHKRNTNNLAKKMSAKDQLEFSFDTKKVKWPSYLETCVVGVRKYYHGEQDDTLALARDRLKT
ncbi:hypothetical protein O3M35_007670 [Rhynocoris fuscipes]|uniref:Fatty acyl-CoA reductase n=1 Tax=Rhynocoris fuscipes TaxID=488301 RepID=A0AAW1DCT8_9HEMI